MNQHSLPCAATAALAALSAIAIATSSAQASECAQVEVRNVRLEQGALMTPPTPTRRPWGASGKPAPMAAPTWEATAVPLVLPLPPVRMNHRAIAEGATPEQAFMFDVQTGRVERFDYGADAVVEEHICVPKPQASGERDAWLVGTTFDARRQVTVVNVIDARHVADGPIARAALPYKLPLGFHGNFTAT